MQVRTIEFRSSGCILIRNLMIVGKSLLVFSVLCFLLAMMEMEIGDLYPAFFLL
jgi:hypothetical protein